MLGRLIVIYFCVAMVIAADQVTKIIALNLVFYPPRIIELLPFLRIIPVWNQGISFGFLQNAGSFVSIALTIFAVAIGIILPFVARKWPKITRYGAILVAGGALGNAIDRIIHGKVVDFIDIFAGQWHWPAFNIADSAIVIGAMILCFFNIKQDKNSRTLSRKKTP